jgi:hypothetical protein
MIFRRGEGGGGLTLLYSHQGIFRPKEFGKSLPYTTVQLGQFLKTMFVSNYDCMASNYWIIFDNELENM